MSDEQKVTRSVVVDATPEQVFALLADPRKHPELDGGGTVRRGISGPPRLSAGAKFGMRMKMFGVPYVIRNEVVEYDENRLIAWRHPGHHVWRWELAPATGSTEAEPKTTVTETFDYGPARSPAFLEKTGFVGKNTVGIEKTLAALQQRFA